MSESTPATAEFTPPLKDGILAVDEADAIAKSVSSNPQDHVEAVSVPSVEIPPPGPTPEQIATQEKSMIEGATTLKQLFFQKLDEKFIAKKYIELVSVPQDQIQLTEDGRALMKIERDVPLRSKILTWNRKHLSPNVRFGDEIESVKRFKFVKVHFVDSMWEGSKVTAEGKTKEEVIELLGHTMGGQLNDLVCDALDLWLDYPKDEPEVKPYGKVYSVSYNYFGDMWNYVFHEDIHGNWIIRVGACVGLFFIEERHIII